MKNFGAYSIQEFCSSSFFDSQSLKAIYALNQTNAPEVGFLDSVDINLSPVICNPNRW